MSPVEIALVVACALMLAAITAAVLTMRQVTVRSADLQRAVDLLRERVEELSRRETAYGAAEESVAAEASDGAREADWLITTYDGRRPDGAEPASVSTQQVVSTTLGEPLLKVAALSHGVRRALREERRAYLGYQIRREYRRRRRQSRARARAGRGGATP